MFVYSAFFPLDRLQFIRSKLTEVRIAVSSKVTTVRILSLSHSAEIHFAISMVKHQVNVVSNIDFYSCRRPFSMTVLLSDHSQWFRMASFFFSIQSDSATFLIALNWTIVVTQFHWIDLTRQKKK